MVETPQTPSDNVEPQSPSDQAAAGERIAAIDVGSNSVRLVVADVLSGGSYRVMDEERENTRLAAALATTGRLDPAAAQASLAVLGNFLSITSGYGVRQTRAIGTSAIRDADDGDDFCRRVRNELGLDIDVISAAEEARLAFLSVARAFDIAGREVAVADIGGGSTEVVLASSGLVDEIYATRLGTVRIADECGLDGALSDKQLTRVRKLIDRTLRREIGRAPLVPDMLFGTGGTFTAMASIMMSAQGQVGQPMWGFRATRAQVRHLVADLAQLSLDKRCKVPGLNPNRADIIVPGLAIIERIMRHLRTNTVQVHTRGVRDGLLLTMIQQSPPQSASPDERRAAVEQFARSAGLDITHVRQVSRIAGSLWEQLAGPLGLRADDRELIESAAILANVGYLINFEGHHKHSYHLILNSELPGFEREQLGVLATVARYHRGAPPKHKHPEYRRLREENQHRVAALAAILRLALALDRTHQQHVEEVVARVEKDHVQITVKAHGDADVDLWAARRKVELFEKVFGREVYFSATSIYDVPPPARPQPAEGDADDLPAGSAKPLRPR